MTGKDLVVRDVGCRLRSGRVILRDVTATFVAGAVSVVIGENGSGKSTLARILAGVDPANGGSVQRPTGRTHLVPERAPALAGCSAQTLVRAFAPRGASRSAVDSRLVESLVALGFSHESTSPLGRLSKGNLQKAHLAVAYAVAPSLAIVDEPATGLDARARAAAARLLRQLAEAGSVVIITAHSPVTDVDQSLQIVDGRLLPMAVDRSVGRAFVVELRNFEEARAAVSALTLGTVVGLTNGVLRVRVGEPDIGAFLVAATDIGCVVIGVAPVAAS